MDCGPAALKSFLEGHGLHVSYGRLREACQTGVDGTSIEVLEELSTSLGLPAEQILIPKDHVLLDEAHALPAIAVVGLPNGNVHFVVVWSKVGSLVQVMDPGSGRRWMTRAQLMHDLFEHVMEVASSDWRSWAGSTEGVAPLRLRLEALGLQAAAVRSLIDEAIADPTWKALAALDASVRAVRSMLDAKAVSTGQEDSDVVRTLFRAACAETGAVPKGYWSVRPAETHAAPDEGDSAEEPTLVVRGAVLVRRDPTAGAAGPTETPEVSPQASRAAEVARSTERERPGRTLLELLWRDGALAPLALLTGLFAASTAVVIEALLFRSLLELSPLFGLSEYRVGVVVALAAFMVIVWLLDFNLLTGELRLGRRLESRIRLAFQLKIPRLGDRYFRSRLVSDMAERCHAIHLLRGLPRLGGELARLSFELLLTAAAIIWFEPSTALLVALTVVLVVVISAVGQPILYERDLRVRTHVGGLSRFYLDALLGLTPLRAHGAARALATEHEGLMVEWARARFGLQRAVVALEALQFVAGFGLMVVLLLSYLNRGGEPAAVLLLAYWALNLPVLALGIVNLAWCYPELRNVALRVDEPLAAPEEEETISEVIEKEDGAAGVALALEKVGVLAGGHQLLSELELGIEPGSHVAIVGRSGAGKSSLVGLFLGFHVAEQGRVLVDGQPLTGARLGQLRAETAWVDPAVQIWNRSLVENLRYGGGDALSTDLGAVVDQAQLRSVLEMLPEGHQTHLGEGGGLVSGGEGQRVRLARAFLRSGVRLVILDEPFRGLGREQRSELLRRSRRLWSTATLLCVTHDIGETRDFDRVLVVEDGCVVEDGVPADLAERAGSLYARLLATETSLAALWADDTWRHWSLENRAVRDLMPRSPSESTADANRNAGSPDV